MCFHILESQRPSSIVLSPSSRSSRGLVQFLLLYLRPRWSRLGGSESLVLPTFSTPVSLVSSVSKVNSRSYRAGQVGSRRSRRILFLILAPPKKFRTRKKIFCDLLFSDSNSTSDGSGKMPFPIKKLILSRFLPFSSLPR